MNLVLDTNVLLSAFAFRGVCNELFEHCALRHRIVVSDFILREFREKFIQTFRASEHEAVEARRLIRFRSERVEPAPVPKDVCRDPEDLPVLGTALSGGCVCIVTGDKDLLDIGRFRGISIVTPAGFWRFEAEGRSGSGGRPRPR
ncbi:MAG: putative toxin-antitoxin system toxin component, PIN family [Planctomycetota bacterium]